MSTIKLSDQIKTLTIIAILLVVGLVFFFLTVDAHAELTNEGIFQNVINQYKNQAQSWFSVIYKVAERLFWMLATISMVWTFGMMALRKADLGEFFAEFIRFIVFTGFFWWLLKGATPGAVSSGGNYATSIINSLQQLGASASGLDAAKPLQPTGIVDMGFQLFNQVMEKSSWFTEPGKSLVGAILAGIILVVLALIAVNMTLLLISSYILAYAGIFFLGFGGSRWTSDMAINYYKTVLGVAAQLLTMVLLVGIGKTFLTTYYTDMSKGVVNLNEMAVMMIVVIILLMLVEKVPPLISGIITGSSVGGGGIGAFGAGAAMGAMGAAATGGKMIGAGVMGAAGGVSALKAAFEKAGGGGGGTPSSNTDVGNPGLAGSMGSPGGGGKAASAGGASPYAQAAGYANDVGSSWSSSGSRGGGGSGSQSTETGAQAASGGGGGANGGGSKGGSGSNSAGGGDGAKGGSSGRKSGMSALMGGMGDVAKAAWQSQLDKTTGGKIANAIRAERTATTAAAAEALAEAAKKAPAAAQKIPSFGGNNLSPEQQEEINAFANRS